MLTRRKWDKSSKIVWTASLWPHKFYYFHKTHDTFAVIEFPCGGKWERTELHFWLKVLQHKAGCSDSISEQKTVKVRHTNYGWGFLVPQALNQKFGWNLSKTLKPEKFSSDIFVTCTNWHIGKIVSLLFQGLLGLSETYPHSLG